MIIAMKNSHPLVLLIRPGHGSKYLSFSAANRLIPLSLRYCAALLEQKEIDTVELDGLVCRITPSSLLNWAKESKPQAAIFSIERFQQRDFDHLFSLTSAIKKAGAIKTLAFGPFPTFFPDCFLGKDRFDAVIPGEPEGIVTKALERIIDGKSIRINGIITGKKRSSSLFVKDVDSLPFPKRHPWDIENYYCNYPIALDRKAVWGSMLAGRGCGKACTFCSPFDRATFSKKVRPRNLEYVREEAKTLIKMGVNVISFEDDDPTFDKERTLALGDILAPLKTNFVCHSRVDELDDHILKSLSRAGCRMIKLGVESGSPRIIDLLKKGDGKTWPQETIKVVTLAKKYGIGVCGLFILGAPTETEQDLKMTMDLMLKAPFDLIQLHYFTPYPGSSFFTNLAAPLDAQKVSRLYHYDPKTPVLTPYSQINPAELKTWARKMTYRFIFRPGFLIRHLKNYGNFHFHNPDTFMRLVKGVIS